jgi:hypothetical protein
MKPTETPRRKPASVILKPDVGEIAPHPDGPLHGLNKLPLLNPPADDLAENVLDGVLPVRVNEGSVLLHAGKVPAIDERDFVVTV